MKKYFPLLASQTPKANWIGWIIQTLILAGIVGLIKWFFPTAIPYKFFESWATKGSVGQWFLSSWPILVWAIGFTIVVSVCTRNSRFQNQNAEEFLVGGLWLSLRAGVMEELTFRWLLFMIGIPLSLVLDFMLGGFIFEHGLIWWLNQYIFFPVANFVTFGLLENVLVGEGSWLIASGLLFANAKFRDGHKYQGIVGAINSWFIGMYFFYLLLTFGMLAPVVIHVAYDAFIFVIRYLDRVYERSNNISDNSRDSETADLEI